jgi:phage terminase small subunit
MTKPKKKAKKAGNLRARFVDEFMLDRNATQAAIRAGYSPKTAQVQGSRLLCNAVVLAEINKRGAEQSQRLQITSDRIMQEYERLALLDPLDLFNADGTMKALKDIPEDARRAIAGLEIKELRAEGNEDVVIQATLKKLKFSDKKGALDSLAKIMGLMKERVEVTGQVTLGALLGIAKEGN